jgi:DeoR family fructose operon transcriptional repressor
MGTMLANERKNKIIELVNHYKIMKVTDLSHEFRTTETTIRRDLNDLQRKNIIRRIHGGATVIMSTSRTFSHSQLSEICIEEKKAIAKRAYEFIHPNDAVLLDASTTVLELAKLLIDNRRDVTIITNSFLIISLIADKKLPRVIHTGGEYTPDMHYAIGPITQNMLSTIRVDRCFLGTNGIDSIFGFSTPGFDDSEVKKLMIIASKERFVLADHTKFGECFMAKFTDFSGNIDHLITDILPANIDRSPYLEHMNLIEVFGKNPER